MENNNNNSNIQVSNSAQNMPTPPAPTDILIKVPLALIAVVPMLLFSIFLSVDYDALFGSLPFGGILGNHFWATVLISLAWLVVVQFTFFKLINKYEHINADIYSTGFAAMGLMMGWYLIPQWGWSRFWVMPITAFAGVFIGKGIAMIFLLRKGITQLKMVQKQMGDFQRQQQSKEDYSNAGQSPDPKSSKKEQKKAQDERMDAMIKNEKEMLDQMLREQGINIDELDEEYGTALDAFDKAGTLNIDKYNIEEGETHSADVVEIVEKKDH